MRRNTWISVAAIAALALAFAVPANADVTVTQLACQGGTSLGAPPGAYVQWDVTGLDPATQYAFAYLRSSGLWFGGALTATTGLNAYTGDYAGPLTIVVFPLAAATFDADGSLVSYDPAAVVFSTTVQIPVCFPDQGITILQGAVGALGLAGGTTTSLDAKLQHALDAVAAGKANVACNELSAFVNEVQAASGKSIAAADAAALLAVANEVQALLGCP